MVRRTAPEDDHWQNEKDAKKRKKIQDRLAQRARRQRVRQARLTAEESVTQNINARPATLAIQRLAPASISFLSEDQPMASDAAEVLSDEDNSQTLVCSAGVTRAAEDSWKTTFPCPDSESLNFGIHDNVYFDNWAKLTLGNNETFSPSTQPNHPFTVFSALYINGEIQGIPCATTYSSRTPAPKPSIPFPLHPTETQLMIVHPRWIDRLPFPKMRDSLIKLRGVVDEEEILKDIFVMPSWTIIPGRACWDPKAWVMEKAWADKWGWLML